MSKEYIYTDSISLWEKKKKKKKKMGLTYNTLKEWIWSVN